MSKYTICKLVIIVGAVSISATLGLGFWAGILVDLVGIVIYLKVTAAERLAGLRETQQHMSKQTEFKQEVRDAQRAADEYYAS